MGYINGHSFSIKIPLGIISLSSLVSAFLIILESDAAHM